MIRGVAVLSGKGGTGKTLISINLATSLLRRGYRTALLDADFSNPNTATLLGLDVSQLSPQFTEDHRVVPMTFETLPGFEYFTIEAFSRDYGVGKSGSEYARLVSELVGYADWHSDYLVIDTPAGYYDIHKTIVSTLDENYLGSIIVANPAHPRDLRKVLDLHRINEISVIGVVENMSGFRCEKCGTEYDIFGQSSTEDICREFGVEFIGSIPLSMDIRRGIAEANPVLPEEMRNVVEVLTDRVLSSQPRRAGFLRELVEKIDQTIDEKLTSLMVQLIISVNELIPIRDIQAKFNFPGNRVIRLNLLDKSMRHSVKTVDFVIRDGRLKILSKPADKPDVQIDMYYKALAWALLGEKKTADGVVPYDFWRAIWNDEVRVYGEKGSEQMQGWYFLRNALSEVMERGGDKLVPLLRVIA